uniref:Uncharacterized protein n=1 Tax=Chromera velia CCMP2878 TaxID=1169474 RepID=A0A0G4HP23_9ALVE|eukprot:Cvel_29695.t1-p1 / transcript=Cvel_29695.t1 / gene=Cvel_29695 / organism=Chromera_velia_CCMP2878 / gene_product=hypothetical protein / transcript_product=hypothetical protein / location=Cvel_scaffold4113:436-2567(+) / protein_length=270 / sequence_SO=supercontig / SO=protein_coding / is_pseudo=false
MIMACIVASRLLLGGFLFYRVISRKSDGRFDEVRTKFWSFFAFWTFQLIWCWGVSLNAIFALTDEQNPPLGPSDYVGVVLFAVALVLQTGADLQKNAFRQNPENKGIPCTKWFWAVSRHPNYFGEMLQWWMIFLLSAPVLWKSADQWGWVTVISPVLTMLILLFLSGMPTAEGKALERFYKSEKGRPIIEDYMESVPPIIPFVPVLYRLFPRWLKMLICFEFPMYQYSPSSDEEGDPEGGAGTGGRMHGVSGAPGQQQLMSPGSDDKRSS